MNIVILGAGRVGEVLVEQLQHEEHQLTVVDLDRDFLETVRGKGENIVTVPGDATDLAVLDAANLRDADMLIAVTGRDSVNIVATQYAKTFFEAQKVIARVRSLDENSKDIEPYLKDYLQDVSIVNPELLAREHLRELLAYPGAHQVLEFCSGAIKLVGLRASAASPTIGMIAGQCELPEHAQLVAAYDEDGNYMGAIDTYKIAPNHMLMFIAPSDQVNATIAALIGEQSAPKHICVAGLGNVGGSIAKALHADRAYRLDLIELDRQKAEETSRELTSDRCIVHNGSAHDRIFLSQCDVDTCDVFCASTANDEINVLAALEALHVGARRAIALVGKSYYKRILTRHNLVVMSLEQILANHILSEIMEGRSRTYSPHISDTEMVEIKVEGEYKESNVTERAIGELNIPHGACIVMIMRGSEILSTGPDTVIQAGDDVVVFIPNTRDAAQVVRFFQVKATAFFL